MPARSSARRRSTRALRPLTSSYAHAILRLVVFVGAATGPQILHELGTRRRKHPTYVARILQRLVQRRMLSATRLQPKKGRARAMAYQITEAGLRFLDIEPSASPRTRLSGRDLRTRVQFAEVILTRLHEGWKPVPPTRGGFATLKRWALQQFDGRLLSAGDRSKREALAKVPDDTAFRHYLLTRTGADGLEARILIHCPPRKNLRRYVKGLPRFALFPMITFELVAESPGRLQLLTKTLDRLAKRRGFRWEPAAVAPTLMSERRETAVVSPQATWTRWHRVLGAAESSAPATIQPPTPPATKGTRGRKSRTDHPLPSGYGLEGMRPDLFGTMRPMEQGRLFADWDQDSVPDDRPTWAPGAAQLSLDLG